MPMPMPIPHHFFPSSTFILILTLLHCLHLASSQTTTESALPASSTSTVLPLYNFTYPTFPDHYGSGIQASYKDTIDVSWVANGLQHAPVLQIVCWHRNDSSSFIYYQNPSSYTHDVTTSPTPSLPSYSLALAPYKQYSPCELRLKDPPEDTETVTSVAIFISDKTNASTAGVEWSADNPAPKVAVDAGVATATSDSAGTDHKRIERIVWAFVGAVAAATVLL